MKGMMLQTKSLLAIGLVLAGLLSGTAQGALVDRGGGMLYDDVLNITWLQDANYARTSLYDADGHMTWSAATKWATDLVYGGFDDWRLPKVIDTGDTGCAWATKGTECGYNLAPSAIANSELAYMYYTNLGLQGYYDDLGGQRPDWGIFGNATYNGVDNNSIGEATIGLVQHLEGYLYWSGTAYAPAPSNFAWFFYTLDGGQHFADQSGELNAWAVRDGDVLRSTVPEPATLALLGLGLAGLGFSRRKQ